MIQSEILQVTGILGHLWGNEWEERIPWKWFWFSVLVVWTGCGVTNRYESHKESQDRGSVSLSKVKTTNKNFSRCSSLNQQLQTLANRLWCFWFSCTTLEKYFMYTDIKRLKIAIVVWPSFWKEKYAIDL